MLPDDIFRSRLDATIASLRYWAPTITDAATIHEDEGGSYWRMTVLPLAGNACPFEIVLRTDQRHDLTIGRETYEDAPTDSLDLFVPLATAISEGRLIQRHLSSAATGLACSVETIVELGNGQRWRAKRLIQSASGCDEADALRHDLHFLPYRRG